MIGKMLALALGGACGAAARYAAVQLVGRLAGGGFPWGTLAVNVGGCFLMGLAAAAMARTQWPERAALLIAPGFLGGFTTFSAFSLEALGYAQTGAWGHAAAYVLASNALGLGAAAAGFALGRWAWSP